MNSNFVSSSMKRGTYEDQNNIIVKKSKLNLSSAAIFNEKENKPSSHVNILTSNKQTTCKPKKLNLVSLISCELKEKVDINPCQIVWSRCSKSSFWPSMVWPTKTGTSMNENNQVLVKRFAKTGDNVWIKLENIFQFDGVDSLKKMKNSVNMSEMTLIMKRDFDFAFHVSNELWPRAVAEATFCMSKPDDERLTFFFILLEMDRSLNVLGELTSSSLNRRSTEFQNDEEVNTSNSYFTDFRINEQLKRITSFFQNVDTDNVTENKLPESTSLTMPIFEVQETNERDVTDLQQIDEEFLAFVMKSREKNTFFDDIKWDIKCGTLLYCTTCPQSFHKICMQSTSTIDNICFNCLKRRHPVYGDIVWAKMYEFTWPAIIVPSRCIPSYMENAAHSEHDLCVRFFEEREFKWIKRELLYPFNESDLNRLSDNNPKLNEAILSSSKWFSKMKQNKENQFFSDDTMCPKSYEKIMENTFVAPAKLVINKNSASVECKCDITDEYPCGPTSNCINRMIYVECDDLCSCTPKCGNRRMQMRIHAKIDLKFFGVKGFGIIASERISAGSFVIDYVGEVITALEYKRRINDEKRHNCYFMKYSNGFFIDAELKGNLSRFINHSCNPNCMYETWTSNGVDLVAVIAIEDIPKDTEITCTYEWSKTKPCLCNEPNCVKFL